MRDGSYKNEIIFDANGGTGTMSPQEVFFNTPTALNENTFVNGYKVFTEWSTVADGTGIRWQTNC